MDGGRFEDVVGSSVVGPGGQGCSGGAARDGGRGPGEEWARMEGKGWKGWKGWHPAKEE